MNRTVIGYVIAVVAQWGRKKRHQPDGIAAKFLNVVQTLRQTLKIADAIPVGVIKRPNVYLVDDGIFVPAGFPFEWQTYSCRFIAESFRRRVSTMMVSLGRGTFSGTLEHLILIEWAVEMGDAAGRTKK
jgi:hypothetical protein